MCWLISQTRRSNETARWPGPRTKSLKEKHPKAPKLETGLCQKNKNVGIKNKNSKTIPIIDNHVFSYIFANGPKKKCHPPSWAAAWEATTNLNWIKLDGHEQHLRTARVLRRPPSPCSPRVPPAPPCWVLGCPLPPCVGMIDDDKCRHLRCPQPLWWWYSIASNDLNQTGFLANTGESIYQPTFLPGSHLQNNDASSPDLKILWPLNLAKMPRAKAQIERKPRMLWFKAQTVWRFERFERDANTYLFQNILCLVSKKLLGSNGFLFMPLTTGL